MTKKLENHLPEEDRVRRNTAEEVNARLDEEMRVRLRGYSRTSKEEIGRRLEELNHEWDIERFLEMNAASVALSGVIMATVSKNKKWLALPAIVLGFLLQHSLQGWCPPIPLFRRLGARTRQEIDRERFALKALRGDFGNINARRGKA